VPTPRWLVTAIVPPFSSMLRSRSSPKAGAGRLGREVRLEDLAQRVLIHPDPAVGHLHDQRLTTND
jgi:hypothetical protein